MSVTKKIEVESIEAEAARLARRYMDGEALGLGHRVKVCAETRRDVFHALAKAAHEHGIEGLALPAIAAMTEAACMRFVVQERAFLEACFEDRFKLSTKLEIAVTNVLIAEVAAQGRALVEAEAAQ